MERPELLSDVEWQEMRASPLMFVGDELPAMRRLAIAVCGDALAASEDAAVRGALETALEHGESGADRSAAAEALGRSGERSVASLLKATADPDVGVVEAVATALGEIGSPSAVPWLLENAATHEDNLVRESAVAALGAIGDRRAVALLLELVDNAPPQVRRRAVVALTVFDDPRIEPALRNATKDRNPMVREVAELVVGHASEWTRLQLGADQA